MNYYYHNRKKWQIIFLGCFWEAYQEEDMSEAYQEEDMSAKQSYKKCGDWQSQSTK
jgi:putative component of toxin-antitoxin plasmid stabilization module